MIDLKKESLDNDFQEIFRAFNLPYDNFNYEIEVLSDNVIITIIYDKIYSTSYKVLSNKPNLIIKRHIKRLIRRDLYRILSNVHSKKLPYGSLTGVRPTKLYYDILEEGIDSEKELIDNFDVSINKASLIRRVTDSQKGYYNKEFNKVNLFINIPFCNSRCAYCSFISAEIGKSTDIIDEYTDKLLYDIDSTMELISNKGQSIRAIYVGGGTPTSLPERLFSRIMGKISGLAEEITVEAGRPDSINQSKLQIMKESLVTRISINPQTFNHRTLNLIGRNHSIDCIYKVYEEARVLGFDINMDLIAMLPEEKFEDFVHSIDEAVRLRPDNITIHTLSIKKGSKLKLEEFDNKDAGLAERMINYADNTISENGYNPYYMYRQKYMSGNLENTGYTLSNKQCKYNIDIMEETHSIIACGAGGISKRIISDRIERAANVKDIKNYLERIDEMIERRRKLFD